MPQWAKHSTCMKCKKKGHLALNCPPKYNCKFRKTQMKNIKPNNKKNPKTQREESAALVKEFAGTVISTNMRNDHTTGSKEDEHHGSSPNIVDNWQPENKIK